MRAVPTSGESPTRPGCLNGQPEVDVAAARCPFRSRLMTPTVSWLSSVLTPGVPSPPLRSTPLSCANFHSSHACRAEGESASSVPRPNFSANIRAPSPKSGNGKISTRLVCNRLNIRGEGTTQLEGQIWRGCVPYPLPREYYARFVPGPFLPHWLLSQSRSCP